MTPEELGDALSWTGDTVLIDRLDEALAAETGAALEGRLDPSAKATLAALPPRARQRLQRAPEVTRRLLFASPAPSDLATFLAEAIAVEGALAGGGSRPATPCWSALGDACLLPDGTTAWWPQIEGRAMVLDFGSPWAQGIDLSGRLEHTATPRRQFTDDELQLVHGRVAATMATLGELSVMVSRFVDRATCVLVLQIDPASPTHVASGTNGNYIGRSFVTNPQLEEGTLDCLAEGVVHEAIHGLLYRDSLRRPWVRGEAANEVPRLRSPWTGRSLTVRAYLEAACVWFGLAHLWALGHQAQLFEPVAVRRRLVRSVTGFGQGALVDRVKPWRADIRPDIVDTIDGLQHRVVDALAEAA